MNRRYRAALAILAIAGSSFAIAGPASAECAPGSVTLKADLYTISIDANRLITFNAKVGLVTKKATLKADCTSTTSYTISGTNGKVPYPNGTVFQPVGSVNFLNAGTITVVNGGVDATVVGSGLQTGINSDSFALADSTGVRRMQVKQPWR